VLDKIENQIKNLSCHIKNILVILCKIQTADMIYDYSLLQAISSSNNGRGNNGGLSSRKNIFSTPAAEFIFSQASSSSANGSSPIDDNNHFLQQNLSYFLHIKTK
jgi:hypothetical protein